MIFCSARFNFIQVDFKVLSPPLISSKRVVVRIDPPPLTQCVAGKLEYLLKLQKYKSKIRGWGVWLKKLTLQNAVFFMHSGEAIFPSGEETDLWWEINDPHLKKGRTMYKTIRGNKAQLTLSDPPAYTYFHSPVLLATPSLFSS